MYPRHLTRRRLAALVAAVAVSAAVLSPAPLAAAPSTTPTAPVSPGGAVAPSWASPASPTDAPGAQQAKTAAEQQVQSLRQVIADQAREIAALTTRASRAEQDYQAQLDVQARAQLAADRAGADRVRAQARSAAAHSQFVRVVIASFEDGTNLGVSPTARLLVADDPAAALNAETAVALISNMQATVTADAEAAASDMRRADARVAAALRTTRAATARLLAIRTRASQALDRSHGVIASLKRNLVLARDDQAKATAVLSTFLGGWSVADPAAAAAANLQYAQLAKRAAALPAAPAGPHWTPAMGQAAAYRALRWIGTPYAWAGGGGSGPSRGVCAAGAAHNDCRITGFDCSGLAMFAWAPYRPMAHFAATQYGAGRVHPGVADLLPGDLVFWSNGPSTTAIHHVAIYVGDGNVVQAPQSGDIVRVTPLGHVSSGYFGATRPMS